MSKISIGQKCNKFVDIFDIAGGGEHKGQGGEGAGRGRLAVCGESFLLLCLDYVVTITSSKPSKMRFESRKNFNT